MRTAYGTPAYGATHAQRTCKGGCERRLSEDYEPDTCPDCEREDDERDEEEEAACSQ